MGKGGLFGPQPKLDGLMPRGFEYEGVGTCANSRASGGGVVLLLPNRVHCRRVSGVGAGGCVVVVVRLFEAGTNMFMSEETRGGVGGGSDGAGVSDVGDGTSSTLTLLLEAED